MTKDFPSQQEQYHARRRSGEQLLVEVVQKVREREDAVLLTKARFGEQGEEFVITGPAQVGLEGDAAETEKEGSTCRSAAQCHGGGRCIFPNRYAAMPVAKSAIGKDE